MVAVVLLAEGFARIIDGQVPRVDQRGHPEMDIKWAEIERRAEAGESPEVIVFGNSMMDAAFLPDSFERTSGKTAYNAAFFHAPLSALDRWTALVVTQAEPDVAVLMIHPFDTVEGNIRFGQDGGTLAANFDHALAQIDPGPLDRLEARAEDASALVRNRATIRQPGDLWSALHATATGSPPPEPSEIGLEGNPVHSIRWDQVLDADGWNSLFRESRLRADFRFDISFLTQLVAEPDIRSEPTRLALRAMGEADRQILVIPPVATSVLVANGLDAADLGRRSSRLAEIAEEEGVEVIDLSAEAWPLQAFHDPLHMSEIGARRFTSLLAERLAQ